MRMPASNYQILANSKRLQRNSLRQSLPNDLGFTRPKPVL
jgi:hypothetical protein